MGNFCTRRKKSRNSLRYGQMDGSEEGMEEGQREEEIRAAEEMKRQKEQNSYRQNELTWQEVEEMRISGVVNRCFGCGKATTDLGPMNYLTCKLDLNKHIGAFCVDCLLCNFSDSEKECVFCQIDDHKNIKRDNNKSNYVPDFVKKNPFPSLEEISRNIGSFQRMDKTRQKIILANLLMPKIEEITHKDESDFITNYLLNLQMWDLKAIFRLFINDELLRIQVLEAGKALKEHQMKYNREYGSIIQMGYGSFIEAE